MTHTVSFPDYASVSYESEEDKSVSGVEVETKVGSPESEEGGGSVVEEGSMKPRIIEKLQRYDACLDETGNFDLRAWFLKKGTFLRQAFDFRQINDSVLQLSKSLMDAYPLCAPFYECIREAMHDNCEFKFDLQSLSSPEARERTIDVAKQLEKSRALVLLDFDEKDIVGVVPDVLNVKNWFYGDYFMIALAERVREVAERISKSYKCKYDLFWNVQIEDGEGCAYTLDVLLQLDDITFWVQRLAFNYDYNMFYDLRTELKVKPETTLFIDPEIPADGGDEIIETAEWFYECRVSGLEKAEEVIKEMIEVAFIEKNHL